MRILEIIDSSAWAIGALAKAIQRKNPHLDIDILEIHPKDLRNKPEIYNAMFEERVKSFKPDVIHFHYWESADRLAKLPACKNKKIILTHHNQKNLLDRDWSNFDYIACHTQKAQKELQDGGYWKVEVIQHGIDIEKYKFNDKYDVKNNTIGSIGRIVPWKGIYEIAKVTKELKQKVICLGRIDKGDYWNKCIEYKDAMDIRFGTPEEEKLRVIHEMGIYVGNSEDNIEEGTLGLLECMAAGIPVVTTASGEAKDIIKDGENGILVKFNDEKSLKEGIQKMMKADKNKIRESAWNTVKVMSEEVMARNYEKLYYKVVYGKDLVSVIIPTCGRPDTILQVVEAYKQQTYQPLEIIVVEDDIQINGTSETKQAIFDYATNNRGIPIKYLCTNHKDYGLAMARNMGIFASAGNYLVFSDDRFIPEPHAVECFLGKLQPKKGYSAVWGDKGGGKRDFIENFWCIRKNHISDAGMFNERINEYGGQSQEIRQRLRNLGFNLQYEPLARANQVMKSSSKHNKRYEIFRTKRKLWLQRH